MMDFSQPRRRQAAESVVPMINVVFLLLIFFLMTSELAPPEPVEVAPPVAEGAMADRAEDTLYLGEDGTFAYGELRGDAALAAFAAATPGAGQVKADGGAEAAVLARAMRQLAALGLTSVTLVTVPQ